MNTRKVRKCTNGAPFSLTTASRKVENIRKNGLPIKCPTNFAPETPFQTFLSVKHFARRSQYAGKNTLTF